MMMPKVTGEKCLVKIAWHKYIMFPNLKNSSHFREEIKGGGYDFINKYGIYNNQAKSEDD